MQSIWCTNQYTKCGTGATSPGAENRQKMCRSHEQALSMVSHHLLEQMGSSSDSLQTADRIGCRCAYFEVGIRSIKNRICMDYASITSR